MAIARLGTALVLFLFFGFLAAPQSLMAQGMVELDRPTNPVRTANPARPAAFAFSVDMDKLKGSAIGAMISEMESTPVEAGPQGIVSRAKSLSGSFSLPASAQDLMSIGPREAIPFDFAVRVDFPNEAAMAEVWDAITAGFEAAEEDGIQGFRLPNNETPNMLFTKVNGTAMAIGTPRFLNQSTRDLNSKGVAELMSKLPEHSVRVVLDLSNSEDLLDEVRELVEAEGEIPPTAAPFIDVAMKIESLRLSADLQDEKMLVLGIRGRDEEATKEIFQTIDGLLNMAKFAAGAQIAQMKEESPKLAEMASALLASLKPKNEGNQMTLEVPQPAGMAEALREAVESTAKQAESFSDMNRLKQAGLAVHNYYDVYRAFPFSPKAGNGISEKLSWRVHVLPFLEEAPLYQQVNKAEGFDSSDNQKFAEQMPAVLGTNSNSLSDIVHIALDKPVTGFEQITDGTSNTIMFLQYKAGQAWMNPKGLTVDEAVKLFNDLGEGETLLTAYFDGSVRAIDRDSMTAEQFRSALIPNDGK